MTRTNRARPLVAALASALLAPALVAQATRPFPEASELLAVRTVAPDLELDLADLARVAELELAGARPWGPRDVRLLELAAPASPAARRAAVERLAGHPAVAYATVVRRDEYALPMLPTQRILLRFEPDVPDDVQLALLSSFAGLAIERERFGGLEDAWSLWSEASTGEVVLDQVDLLAALDGVRWVESDRVLGAIDHDFLPDDPNFPTSWGLHNTGQMVAGVNGQNDFDMDAPAAWDLEQGDASVIVVVMDNGTQLDHPDLNLTFGADFTDNGSGGGPHNFCSNHGTAVAGCISAIIDNALGVTGVAPACVVAPAAVHVSNIGFPSCPGTSSGQVSWKIDALFWAELVGARVTNWSFSSSFDQAWSDKLDATQANGMIHFASAGNAGANSIPFPASDGSVIAIGAVQNDGLLADYDSPQCPGCGSNTGSGLELVAPGKAIDTTDRTGADGYVAGDYTQSNGTSFASPYAAGVAALVISRHPSIDAFELELVLEMSARDLGSTGYETTFGYGLIDAFDALELADRILPEMQAGYALVSPDHLFPIAPFFQDVTAAVTWVPSGGAVIIDGASYDEQLVLGKDVSLYRWDSAVVVGQ